MPPTGSSSVSFGDDGPPGLDHHRRQVLGREHLERGGAAFQRREGFGRRRDAGRAGKPGRDRARDHGGVAMRHDDEPAAGVADAVDVGRIEHRAGADEHLRAEALRQDLDAAQGLGRVQRHLDDPEPALDQRLADRRGVIGAQAAQDRDERKGGKVFAEGNHGALRRCGACDPLSEGTQLGPGVPAAARSAATHSAPCGMGPPESAARQVGLAPLL